MSKTLTPALATNGRPKFKEACIFCGKNDYLTGEHLFAQWIGKALPPMYGPGTNVHLSTDKGEEFEFVNLSERGGHANARLNVLCEDCNSGWGSILQQQASNILKPILSEKRWRIANIDRSCIASWVTSFTMVRQFLHPTLAVLDAAQRKAFYDTKEPLEGLCLWVANFNGTRQLLSTWYTGLAVNSEVTKPNMFLVALTMGNLLFFSYGTGANVDLENQQEEIVGLKSRLIELGFIPVWPINSCSPIGEPLTLSDEEYRDLVPLLKRSILNPFEPLCVAKNIVENERDRYDIVADLCSIQCDHRLDE